MTSLEQLLAVQEMDTTADQLRHRRESLPARARYAEREQALAEIDSANATVGGQRDELTERQTQLEEEVERIDARVVEIDRTMYGGQVSVPRDLEAMQDEIRSLKRRKRSLEDDVLGVLEAIEPLDEEIARNDAQKAEHESAMVGLLEEIEQAEAEIDTELADAEVARKDAAAEVEAGLLETYEDLRSRLGGVAVARLAGGVCGGCHLSLSAVELDRIKRQDRDAMVHCEECGRILVR